MEYHFSCNFFVNSQNYLWFFPLSSKYLFTCRPLLFLYNFSYRLPFALSTLSRLLLYSVSWLASLMLIYLLSPQSILYTAIRLVFLKQENHYVVPLWEALTEFLLFRFRLPCLLFQALHILTWHTYPKLSHTNPLPEHPTPARSVCSCPRNALGRLLSLLLCSCLLECLCVFFPFFMFLCSFSWLLKSIAIPLYSEIL